MAEDYIPTTEEVRNQIADGLRSTGGIDALMFNRWLAEHDAVVYGRGYDEGIQVAGFGLAMTVTQCGSDCADR